MKSEKERMTNMISKDFAKKLVKTFNDPSDNPVHMLFNQWWKHAPDPVKDAYVASFTANPAYERFQTHGELAPPTDLKALSKLPEGTVGRVYHDWIVDNDLSEQIARDYRKFHKYLVAAGMLRGMPKLMRAAILRGFQVHDYLHVITGYDPSPAGEIALQAFSLAQFQFPYFGMWMSVVTTRMTFCDPESMPGIMDNISHGWALGRRVSNLAFEPWESMHEENLEDVRARYQLSGGVQATGWPVKTATPGLAQLVDGPAVQQALQA